MSWGPWVIVGLSPPHRLQYDIILRQTETCSGSVWTAGLMWSSRESMTPLTPSSMTQSSRLVSAARHSCYTRKDTHHTHTHPPPLNTSS